MNIEEAKVDEAQMSIDEAHEYGWSTGRDMDKAQENVYGPHVNILRTSEYG